MFPQQAVDFSCHRGISGPIHRQWSTSSCLKCWTKSLLLARNRSAKSSPLCSAEGSTSLLSAAALSPTVLWPNTFDATSPFAPVAANSGRGLCAHLCSGGTSTVPVCSFPWSHSAHRCPVSGEALRCRRYRSWERCLVCCRRLLFPPSVSLSIHPQCPVEKTIKFVFWTGYKFPRNFWMVYYQNVTPPQNMLLRNQNREHHRPCLVRFGSQIVPQLALSQLVKTRGKENRERKKIWRSVCH